MRLPSMTTPEPVTSLGADLVQGLNGSGYRSVENTLTTAFSTLTGTAGVLSCAALASEVTNRRPRRSRRDDISRVISLWASCLGFWHRLFEASVAAGGT